MADRQDQDQRNQDKPKRNWGAEIDELRKSIRDWEARLEKNKGPQITKCGVCNGNGFKLGLDGKPMADDDHEPIYCPICQGIGSVKL